MATAAQIKARVTAFFKGRWPQSKPTTNMRDELLLDTRQVLDIGTMLAEELDCNPKRSQIIACKTIADLSKVLVNTRT